MLKMKLKRWKIIKRILRNINHIPKYVQLVEVDNELKWNSIYNEHKLTGNLFVEIQWNVHVLK